MAVGYLPPLLVIFALGASSLLDALSRVASCFFAIYIGVLFFCCFYLFGTLCGCCSWRIHSNSPPPNCFVCSADLLCVRSTAHCSLPGLFSRPHHDELLMPPSASVSGLHMIGFLPAAVIHIVFFPFFFSCIVHFLSCISVFSFLLLDFFVLSLYFPVHFHSCFYL
jgi:hypothetical protein